MSVARTKDAGDLPDVAPPPRSRRGAGGIWIGVGLIVALIMSLLGFFATPSAEAPAAEAVLIDEGGIGR